MLNGMRAASGTQCSRSSGIARANALALYGWPSKKDVAGVLLAAGRGLTLMGVPLDPALGAGQVGTEAMARGGGAIGGIHTAHRFRSVRGRGDARQSGGSGHNGGRLSRSIGLVHRPPPKRASPVRTNAKHEYSGPCGDDSIAARAARTPGAFRARARRSSRLARRRSAGARPAPRAFGDPRPAPGRP